jgi:transcriptional regulator with XRE-family HTH domain
LTCFFLSGILMDLLQQIKTRRLALGYKQKDMLMRIGLSRQQYQQIESKGNPRLDTLELIAKGLNSELMLIPNEKKQQILAILNEDQNTKNDIQSLIDNPWQGLLEEE